MHSNDEKKICVLYGNASEELALKIAKYWGDVIRQKATGSDRDKVTLFAKDVALVNAEVQTFKDGEVSVWSKRTYVVKMYLWFNLFIRLMSRTTKMKHFLRKNPSMII